MVVTNLSATSRLAGLFAAVLLGALAVASDACVIADPPTDLPRLPAMRPVIVRGSVVPPLSAVLGRWPSKFIVPVELVDPQSQIFYSAFIDYNAATGEGLESGPTSSDVEPARVAGRVRTLEVIMAEPSLDRCHVVEIVVALRFKATTDSKNAHTPDEPGGDSATWFFSPSGDLAGCPVLDAGIRPLTDAGASEGGAQ